MSDNSASPADDANTVPDSYAAADSMSCPECGRDDSWNDLGCMRCGLEFFPPSEAYWAASTLTIAERVAGLREDRGAESPEPELPPAAGAHDESLEVTPRYPDYLESEVPETREGQLALLYSFIQETAPVPEIGCPNCCTAQLETRFTCPACGYVMDSPTRLEFNIFWDYGKRRWYRAHLTSAENWFWGACLAEYYPWVEDTRAQACIGSYRTDFMLTKAMIVIEIDGFSNHRSETEITRDRQRHRWMQAQGYAVIRFSNPEVLADARACAAEADRLIRKLAAS
jgi:very-short-patch-repair endonuclease